jgi:hypothetical protein
MRIGLVSCSKAKLDRAAPARELYSRSALFRGARCYVERTCDRWFVVSAKHGLVKPDQFLEPYEQTLTTAPRTEREVWAKRVLAALVTELGELRDITFQLHAGAAYLDHGLKEGLLAAGALLEEPVDRLRQGQRLAFYKRERCL